MSPTADFHTDSRRGLTLIELLVAIAIFTVVITSVILMFTSVTNTVRRSYRVMDIYEETRNALFAVERDVQVTFDAPAVGSSLHFYGEPYGFILTGINPDQELGRLTYAVHRDTSRMGGPATSEGRGMPITMSVSWPEVAKNFPTPEELAAYYPRIGEADFIDFEVEVVYGLLLRFYESRVTDIRHFEKLDRFVNTYPGMEPHLRRPVIVERPGEGDYPGRPESFPWLSTYLWEHADTTVVPWYKRDLIETVEQCHYWLQLLQGPGLRPVQPWSLTNIWWRPWSWDYGTVDQFWYDHVFWNDWRQMYPPDAAPAMIEYPMNLDDGDPRQFLWDHVIAEGFVLESYLLEPETLRRITTSEGRTVPVIGPNPYLDYYGEDDDDDEEGEEGEKDPYPNHDPIFRYAAETANKRSTTFNTLYNLNHGDDNGPKAFERLSRLIRDPETGQFSGDPSGPEYDAALAEMTATRQFYDVGNPLQTRSPSSFDITLWVVRAPVVSGAPPDMFRFSQTVHLPSGFRRRSRAGRF